MAAPVDEESDFFADDFYSLLNVSREASSDEIRAAYRRFSKTYHPDKHIDEKKKKTAELMFFKIKHAYEVLIDEHTRVIYDLYGAKGLDTEGLEVISRTKSAAEIIAEYERLQREHEERILEKCTHPEGVVSLSVDATDVFEPYQESEQWRVPNIEISRMALQQSIIAPLTTRDTTTLSGHLASDNGVGSGAFVCSWRRLLSQSGWMEFQTSVGQGLQVTGHLFRQISKTSYCTVTGSLSSSKHGLSGVFKPQLNTVIAYQLSKHTKGQMSWNILNPTFLTTSVIYDSERHHALTSIQIGTRDMFLLLSYTRKFVEAKVRLAAKLSVFGVQVECGGEKKLTKFSRVGASIVMGVPLGVTVKLKLIRGGQTFICPIHLSENIVPSAVFYGVISPFIAYHVIKYLVVNPFLKQQRDSDMDRKKERFSQLLQQKMSEAAAAVDLMKETVARSIEVEESRKGLIILHASYGKIATCEQDVVLEHECIDVTIPLQGLVRDSKLILPDTTSKSALAGFYDPCYGEDKQLYIRYRFRNKRHQVTIADSSPIHLPQQKHLLTNENDAPVT